MNLRQTSASSASGCSLCIPVTKVCLTALVLDPASIVAVPGLGANSEKTWVRKTPHGEVHWLRDPKMLPARVPNARILVFEYESQWFGKASVDQTLANVANQLVHALQHKRRVSTVPSRFYRSVTGSQLLMLTFIIAGWVQAAHRLFGALLGRNNCREGTVFAIYSCFSLPLGVWEGDLLELISPPLSLALTHLAGPCEPPPTPGRKQESFCVCYWQCLPWHAVSWYPHADQTGSLCRPRQRGWPRNELGPCRAAQV